tara:strand:- start:241 stop:459 length:219 start_codon:yes stop_codon:yes gene_type:complete
MTLTDHFSVRSEGSLAVIHAKSPEACDFVTDHVDVPDHMWLPGWDVTFACELRYVGPILNGFLEQQGVEHVH